MTTTTSPTLPGLHHVTAITADPQKNLDFYTSLLGLRLIKLTVNFDDPASYHLYYGDPAGRPGTVMTFFAWPGAFPGRLGPPQVTATTFAAPSPASLDFWTDRLTRAGHPATRLHDRFGDPVLSFHDPDNMPLEILATSASSLDPGPSTPPTNIPPAHALRGFFSVTLAEEGYERTARLLTDTLGFRPDGADGNRFRYRAAGSSHGSAVDLLCTPDARHGSLGAGIVHHVAFRTPTDPQQAAWRTTVANLGYNVSPVMDRTYFHSIYFREPGGVLFEIATDTPGFTADEPLPSLGTTLKLPPWLEPHRPRIQQALPKLRLPATTTP